MKLIADLHHIRQEGGGAEAVLTTGGRILHCHIAALSDKPAPVTMYYGFRPFFRAPRTGGYRGRFSVGATWADPNVGLPGVTGVLRRQIFPVKAEAAPR